MTRKIGMLLCILLLTTKPTPGQVVEACRPDTSSGDTETIRKSIQTCLERRGVVELTESYTIDRTLRVHSDTVLKSGSSSKVLLLADEFLGSQPILVADGNNYEISDIVFDGNKYRRIDGLCHREDRRSPNVLVSGSNYVIHNIETVNTPCGTGLGVISGFNSEISRVYSAYNGFPAGEYPNKPYQFSDGITVQYCSGCNIHDNLFVENTDFDFLFGGGPGNIVHHNTVIHRSVFGFGGLNIGRMDTGAFRPDGRKWDGDHEGSRFFLNTVQAQRNTLMYGISIGSHPFGQNWKDLTVADGGSLFDNFSVGSQVPLLIEGVEKGVVSENTAKGAQGDNTVYNNCGLAKNYTVGHVGFEPQSGYTRITIDYGVCGR